MMTTSLPATKQHPLTDLQCVLSINAQLIETNDAFEQLFGNHLAGSMNAAFWDIVLLDEQPQVQAKLSKLAELNTILTLEHRSHVPERHIIWLHWLIVPNQDQTFLAIGYDITYHKQMELRLHSLEEGAGLQAGDWHSYLHGLSGTQSDSSLQQVLEISIQEMLSLFDVDLAVVSLPENKDCIHYQFTRDSTAIRYGNCDQEELNRIGASKMAGQKVFSFPFLLASDERGTLNLLSNDLSPQQAKWCQVMANQLAVIISQWRVIATRDDTISRMQHIHQSIEIVASATSTNDVMTRIAQQMVKITNATSAFVVDYIEDANTSTVIAEYFGPDANEQERESDLGVTYHNNHALGDDILERMGNGRCVIAQVAQDAALTAENRAHYKYHQVETVLYVPLRILGKPIGFVEVWDSRGSRSYSDDDCYACLCISWQGAIAIHKAYLLEQLQMRSHGLHDLVEKKTEQLRTLSQHLQAVIDSSANAVFELNADGLIITANKRSKETFGIDAEGPLSKSLEPIFANVKAYEAFVGFFSWARTQVAPQAFETQTRNTLGETIDVNIVLTPVRDSDENAPTMLASIRDITALKDDQRAKDEFITSMSHELRTPITNIILYLSLLARTPEKLDTYLATLNNEAIRLKTLVEDIMFISNLGTREMMTDLALMDAEVGILTCLKNYQSHFEQHNISVETILKSAECQIVSKPHLFHHIVNPLIANAAAYTPAEGYVRVSLATHDDPIVTIEVHNSGSVILPSERPYIYDRFFRGRAASRANLPGTGLGLFICKTLVDLHEGSVELLTSDEQGTTFRVTLPAYC